MGKLVGLPPNENTLEEDFNVIHYLMLGKPKYQLTSKHNEAS